MSPLARRLPHAASLRELLRVVSEFIFSALRRGVGADGVEQHDADGGQGPEETLREERADRRQDERAAASRLSHKVVRSVPLCDLFHSESMVLSVLSVLLPNCGKAQYRVRPHCSARSSCSEHSLFMVNTLTNIFLYVLPAGCLF